MNKTYTEQETKEREQYANLLVELQFPSWKYFNEETRLERGHLLRQALILVYAMPWGEHALASMAQLAATVAAYEADNRPPFPAVRPTRVTWHVLTDTEHKFLCNVGILTVQLLGMKDPVGSFALTRKGLVPQ